jgi:oxygen-independent coproporphyrinogen-3 oxidase
MIDHESRQAGLYIHIPFCLSKCDYCSFYSVESFQSISEFIQSLVQEMEFYKEFNLEFNTIYFGGGTPSLLSIEQISEILKSIYRFFKICSHSEITIEVNPSDLSFDYLKSLFRLGVNRLNIGIQSLDDYTLNVLGRRHKAKDGIEALVAARKSGFENLGIDLIYGVHGQDIQQWQNTLNQVLSFSPEHLSCYQLSLESNTPLFRRYRSENLSLPSEEKSLDYFFTTSQMMTEAGYIHYEVSNFARTSALKSQHNIKYWRHDPYIGLGPSAHSFIERRRWWNVSDVFKYINDIHIRKKPIEQVEELTLEELAFEALFLGLRTNEGIDLIDYRTRFGIDLMRNKRREINNMIEAKLMEIKEERLYPTLSGMALADSLALL